MKVTGKQTLKEFPNTITTVPTLVVFKCHLLYPAFLRSSSHLSVPYELSKHLLCLSLVWTIFILHQSYLYEFTFPHQIVDTLRTESILKSCLWPLDVLHTLRVQYLFHGWMTVSYLWERSDSWAQTHWHTREPVLSLMVAKIMYCGDYFILLSRFGKRGKNEFVWGLQGAF